MKKIFLFAAAAVTMAAGCQKLQEILVTPNDQPVDDNSPVLVSFGTNVSATATTKATGALNSLQNEKLVVFGFEQGADLTKTESYLLGVVEEVSDEGEEATKSNVIKGMEFTLSENPYTTDVYYGDKNYDFYAYYAGNDKGAIKPTTTKTTISVPVTITGQEDLLIAKTNKVKDIAASGNSTVDRTRVYSAHSARRKVIPNLVFDHQLAQFTFKLENGSTLPDGVELFVTSLGVKSETKGNLVIDRENESNCVLVPTPATQPESTVNTLMLPTDGKKEGTNVEPETYVAKFAANATTPVVPTGSVLVMPGDESYDLILNLQQTETKGTVESLTKATPTTLPIQLASGEAFKAGYSYEVTVKVYAQEAVLVKVTLTDWKVGEAISIDPDASAPVEKTDEELYATFASKTATEMVYNVNVPEGYHNVQAALSTSATSVPENATWVNAEPTRASQTVKFTDFLAETVYYCHLRYTEAEGDVTEENAYQTVAPNANDYTVSSVFDITKEPWLVTNSKDSYETLPQAYRTLKGEWDAIKDNANDFPWIAVQFTRTHETVATVKYNGKAIKTFEAVDLPVGLLTVSAKELGMSELAAGTYTFVINGKTATYTHPAPTTPEPDAQ